MVNLDELHQELRSNILAAQCHYQGPADRRRQSPPELVVGGQVYVLAKFFRTTWPSKKLSEKNLGPFKVLGKVGPQSYCIELPNTFKGVHLIFHISQLEPAHPNRFNHQHQEPPPPVEVEGEEEYEINEIVESKYHKFGHTRKLYYYVKWLGYKGTLDEYQWLPSTKLKHAQEAVSDFHLWYPLKPKP